MTGDEYAILGTAAVPPGTADQVTEGSYVRMCVGLAVLAEADRVIVTGGLRRKLLGGPDACRVAADLIPLLNGQRTVAEVCAASGMAVAGAMQVIELLRSSGLVEYADCPFGNDSRLAAHAQAFYSRAVYATGQHRNSQVSLDALANSAVLILATGHVARALRADLRACGIGTVVTGGAADASATGTAVAGIAQRPHPLVVAVETPGSQDALTGAEATCRERDVTMLRAAQYGTAAELGPLFVPGRTACYGCFTNGHDEFFARQPRGRSIAGDAASPALDDVLAAMITAEVLAVLGHIRLPQSYRAVVVTSLTDYSDHRLTVIPRPDCPVCGEAFPGEKADDAAAIYEWEMEAMPASLADPAAGGLERPEIHELATRRLSLPARPSYPLPSAALRDAPDEALPAVPAVGQFGSTELAWVLSRVAGRRAPGHPANLRRWAPSGGNLASVRLYVTAAGRAFGPAAGCLAVYDDMEHRLTVVRAGPVPIIRLLEGTSLAATEPTAALVFVADTARIAAKYGSFGYRLSHLDAGVAAAQLIAVTQELGLAVAFAPAWSPGLDELIEVLPGQEFITALALITAREG